MPAPTAAPAQGGAPQMSMRDFRRNTRQRIPQIVGTLPVAINSTQSINFPQVGLMNRAFLFFDISVVDAAASPSVTAAALAPWGFVKRVQLVTNLGSNNIWDTDGYNAYVRQLIKERNLDMTTGLTGVSNDPLYQFPTTFTQNQQKNIRFCLVLDVAANDGINFGLGLVNLQAPQIQVNLNLQFGAVSDLYTTSDSVTIGGQVTVAYEFYEIPSPLRKVPLPAKVLHCTLQQSVGFASTGAVVYQIPRQGKLLSLLQTIIANGSLLTGGGPTGGAGNASSAGVDSFVLQLNNQDTVYNIPYIVQRMLARRRYGAKELPAGSYLHDYFSAFGEPGRGDYRDTIDTEAVTTTEWTVNINSGVTVGSGNNFVHNTREILLPFSTAAAGGMQ